MLNKSKLLAALLLAAVFAAGAAVGAAAFAERRGQADERARDERSGGERRERRERSYVGWLDAQLTLSPAQRDTVARILEGYQGAMSEIWAEVRPRMDSIRTLIRSQILLVLDSTQQEQYRVLTARSDSTRRQERTREGGRDDNAERSRDKREDSSEPPLW